MAKAPHPASFFLRQCPVIGKKNDTRSTPSLSESPHQPTAIQFHLRSTMSQIRLNNCMVLHVHKDLTDDLDLAEIGNRFVAGSEHRESLFGKFTK